MDPADLRPRGGNAHPALDLQQGRFDLGWPGRRVCRSGCCRPSGKPDAPGNYNTGAQTFGARTGPVLFIPAAANLPSLAFKGWYQTESNGTTWDKRLVQISVNGGAFVTLAQLSADAMGTWNSYSYSLAA